MSNYIFLVIILLLTTQNTVFGQEEYKQNNGIYLNYNDLVELSKTATPKGELFNRLEKQLNTTIISQPPLEQTGFLYNNILGNYIRVGSWNIERGFNASRIAQIDQYADDPKTSDKLKDELRNFSGVSVLILNEADIGLPRTHYQNIAQKIAHAFKMGYVFGTEFVEVDPYQLGVKKFTENERLYLEKEALNQLDNIDKNAYVGLHGTAILSKYPILNTKIIRLPHCYNWYTEESKKIAGLEFARREAAQKIFAAKLLSELRHGGRIALQADILLPNKQKITVVATHLENRCLPICRYEQFHFLLSRLKDIRNPVIIAGDLNTTGTDASPVSIKKEVIKKVKDPEFFAKQAILAITPLTLAQNVVLNSLNKLRQFKDPTTKDIPIVLPNKERKIFDLLKEFRFNDGGTFDVRGVRNKSYSSRGFLSNSNERQLKGYKSTFELERHFGIAKYKLDWFFIKPLNLKESNKKDASYAYAPHFGRTLSLLNESYGKISDHDPITVDIPVDEPHN